MYDIVLVNPYFLDQEKSAPKDLDVYPPIGILYLASGLVQQGYSVGIIDGTFKSLNDVLKDVTESSTQLIGITSNIITRNRALRILEHACGHGISVISGGPDPSTVPDLYLEAGADAVFIGEGETAILEYLKSRVEKTATTEIQIPGLQTSVKKPPCSPRQQISDLSSLPVPDYNLIDINSYLEYSTRHKGFSIMPILSARGCPFPCSWCAKPVFGAHYRAREPEEFVDELEHIVKDFKPDRFRILDDAFTLDKDRTLKIAEEILRRNLHIRYECLTRVDCLDREMLTALKESGCYRIWCGVESGSEKVLNAMNKNVTLEQIKATTRLIHDFNIELACFILAGYPGETREDVIETIRLIDEIKPDDLSVSIAYPIPGTAFYDEVEHLIQRDVGWKHSSQYCPTYRRQFPDLYYTFLRNLILRNWDRKIRLKSAPVPVKCLNAAREAANWFGFKLVAKLSGNRELAR